MPKKPKINDLDDKSLLAAYGNSEPEDMDDKELERIAQSAPYDFFDDPPENYYDPENGWWPSLYPSQMEAFNCEKPYQLYHGERFSGKTVVALSKLIKHSYSNKDALSIIVTITKTSAKIGGAWTKLFSEVLPEWEEGIGLAYTNSRMDSERNHYCKIQNMYGDWSTVMLKSIPAESMIQERWKGAEPTFVFIDELTETPIDATGYFDHISQQLFRKKGSREFFYIGACNPSEHGEDHWVYKKFIQGPQKDGELKSGNMESRAKWEERYANFHIPISQNVDAENLEIYLENLRSTCSSPDEVQRAMEGKWVKRIKGTGIFKHYFLPHIHVQGDKAKNIRLVPHESKGIVVGYDLGDVNQSISFYQDIPVVTGRGEDRKVKTISVVFDEIVLIQERLEGWDVLVRMILNKMNFWCEYAKYRFDFEHVSDKSAINRFRIGQGGNDQKQVQKWSKRLIGEDPKKYRYLRPIKMVDAPKMGGSVEDRVKILINKLIREEIIFDCRCTHHIEMLRSITAKDGSVLTPAPNSQYKHALDSLTYPMFYHSAGENLRTKVVDNMFGVR